MLPRRLEWLIFQSFVESAFVFVFNDGKWFDWENSYAFLRSFKFFIVVSCFSEVSIWKIDRLLPSHIGIFRN